MAYIGRKQDGFGVRSRFIYTATGGQTTFNTDDSGNALSYSDGAYVDVYLNGVLLDPADYTATSLTSIVLDSGATASDILEVIVYDVFSVFSGTFTNGITANTVTVTGDLTVDTSTLKVDSTNNRVGIGTASPAHFFDCRTTGETEQVVANFSSTGNGSDRQRLEIYVDPSTQTTELYGGSGGGSENNTNLAFSTRQGGSGRVEAMRIDSSGNLLVATTSKSSISQFTSDSSPRVQVTGDGSVLPVFSLTRDVTGDGNATGAITFLNDNNSGASGETSKVFAAILSDIGTSDNNAGDDSGGNLRFYTKGEASSIANSMTLSGGGNLTVSGSISKGSGSFKINHPLDSKSDTHHLVHSFVEAPQADNIYRGVVDLVDGTASVNIDTVAGMTDGTFVALNREIQCFTSNETGWIAIKGSVSGNTLTITAQDNTCTDTISWLVIGERKDQHIINSDLTDANGKIIVEPLKSDSIAQVDLPVDSGDDGDDGGDD